jgi:hypothetical protein
LSHFNKVERGKKVLIELNNKKKLKDLMGKHAEYENKQLKIHIILVNI